MHSNTLGEWGGPLTSTMHSGVLLALCPAVGLIPSDRRRLRAGLYDYKFFVENQWALDPSVKARLDASGKNKNHIFELLAAVDDGSADSEDEVRGANLTPSRAPKWLH